MAVVVNISNTEHLSYSPLNEKHNILYYRARNNVNIRHIQRPWFDLNPFLDKEDDKWKDLDKYQPEHDHGITPLESLTIVEDFFSDKPLLTKEFKIGRHMFVFCSKRFTALIRIYKHIYNQIQLTAVHCFI